MKQPLLDVVFMSHITASDRVLEDHHLVNHHKDTYELTTIGKLVVGEMAPHQLPLNGE